MNKGGNFSSKELIMKATQPKKGPAKSLQEAKDRGLKTYIGKDGKKKAAVSRDDMRKKGFKTFGAESLKRFLEGKGPKKTNFSSKKLITEKSVKSGIPKKKTNFSSKSLITKKSIQSGVPKTKKKVLTQNPFKNPNPPVVATKSKTTTTAQNPFKNPNPPIKKMNKGGVFKGIF